MEGCVHEEAAYQQQPSDNDDPQLPFLNQSMVFKIMEALTPTNPTQQLVMVNERAIKQEPDDSVQRKGETRPDSLEAKGFVYDDSVQPTRTEIRPEFVSSGSGRGRGTSTRLAVKRSRLEHHLPPSVKQQQCGKYSCTACHRTYLRREQFVKHLEICAGSSESPAVCAEGSELLVCNVCGEYVCCQYHYSIHVKRHTTRTEYVCQFCQRGAATIEALRRHVETHIGGQTPLMCDHCEMEFQNKIERMLAAPKMMCYAPMIFKTIQELNTHIKFRHGNRCDAPPCVKVKLEAVEYLCSCCTETFSSDYELQVHREKDAVLRRDGLIGCGLYELFNLCLDGKYLDELGLKEVKLRQLIKAFLQTGWNCHDRDFLYASTHALLIKFCQRILDDEDLYDVLYLTPVNDLVSEMVFVLKELWPLDQTYAHAAPKNPTSGLSL